MASNSFQNAKGFEVDGVAAASAATGKFVPTEMFGQITQGSPPFQ